MTIKPKEIISADWFTPKSEHDAEEPTRFKVKPLDSPNLDYALEGAAYSDKGDLIDLSAKGKTHALRNGLIDWENFDAKFTISNFNKLPWDIRQEIAWEIVIKSMMTEDDSKNS